VSTLEWPEECSLVLVAVNRERRLVKTEKWSLVSQIANAEHFNVSRNRLCRGNASAT
jgi:hypothetical protein